MIAGIDKAPDTSWNKIVRSRAAIATQTVIDVYDNGYQETPTSPVRRLKPLFDVTPTFSYKEALDATEKLVISVIFHESSFRVDVERTIDGSSDCSYMQTKPGWISKVVAGKNCNDLKKDPKLAVFVGAEVLRIHKEYCLNKLPEEKKRYSLINKTEATEKTLTDEQVDKAMGRIRSAFEKEVGAELRG